MPSGYSCWGAEQPESFCFGAEGLGGRRILGNRTWQLSPSKPDPAPAVTAVHPRPNPAVHARLRAPPAVRAGGGGALVLVDLAVVAGVSAAAEAEVEASLQCGVALRVEAAPVVLARRGQARLVGLLKLLNLLRRRRGRGRRRRGRGRRRRGAVEAGRPLCSQTVPLPPRPRTLSTAEQGPAAAQASCATSTEAPRGPRAGSVYQMPPPSSPPRLAVQRSRCAPSAKKPAEAASSPLWLPSSRPIVSHESCCAVGSTANSAGSTPPMFAPNGLGRPDRPAAG